MIEQLIGDDDGEFGVADQRVKPALLTLLHDQAELFNAEEGDVTYDIRSGFPDRRRMIEWYQRASVRTLGYIAEKWDPLDCVNDTTLVSALVRNPPENVEPMGPWVAAEYRAMLEAEMLLPACNKAYRRLRSSASEYIRTPDGEKNPTADLDPRKQKHMAMRPGFQTLDEQQQACLDRLWGGFESRDVLSDWLHSLNSPTNGEIRSDIAESVITDPVAMDALVHDRDLEQSRTYREVFAGVTLLPAFVDGIEVVETAELAKTQSGTPTTFRMKGSN